MTEMEAKKEVSNKFGIAHSGLSREYQKARKNYCLFSALLIAWALIGIDMTEMPLSNVNITLKSPQAIPFVLIVLVIYFGFRFVIEWKQCDVPTTKMKIAKIDYYVSHMIALSALAIYIIQQVLNIQIANQISNYGAIVRVLTAPVIAMSFVIFNHSYYKNKRLRAKKAFRIMHWTILFIVTADFVYMIIIHQGKMDLLISGIVILFVIIADIYLYRLYRRLA